MHMDPYFNFCLRSMISSDISVVSMWLCATVSKGFESFRRGRCGHSPMVACAVCTVRCGYVRAAFQSDFQALTARICCQQRAAYAAGRQANPMATSQKVVGVDIRASGSKSTHWKAAEPTYVACACM